MGDSNNEDFFPINVKCKVFRRNNILLDTPCQLLPMADIFVIHIRIRDTFRVYKIYPNIRGPMLHSVAHNSSHFFQSFVVPYETITPNNKNRARHTIHMMLGEAGVPRVIRRKMLGKIYSEAMRLANTTRGQNSDEGEYKRIPILVDIIRVYARVVIKTEAFEFSRVVPPVLKAFEKVRVGEMEEVCVVCLEDMEVEMEVSRMPCKHMLHGSFIAAWLENAKTCPICRFPLF